MNCGLCLKFNLKLDSKYNKSSPNNHILAIYAS